MKKYLINGAMALIVGGFIVSCSHDDISQPATVDQMTKSFDEMFTELYGPIAPNHNWGFETVAAEEGEDDAAEAATRGTTRSAQPNSNQWGTHDDNDKYLDWPKPADITDDERAAVLAVFNQKGKASYTDLLNLTDFFVQQVYCGPNGEKMNQLACWDPQGHEVTEYPDWNGYQPHTYTTNDDEVNNFNGGKYSGNALQGCMLMWNSSTSQWSFKTSQSGGERIYDHWRMEYIPGYGYYVGLDHEAWRQAPANANEEDKRDYIYNDWIIKIVPGKGQNAKQETTTTITRTYKEIVDLGRVFCEDIATAAMKVTDDVDYNDIVFDARVWEVYDQDETTINGIKTTSDKKNIKYQYDICMLAAGGTIPETVGVNNVDVHDAFGVGLTFMVNTWTENSKAFGQYNTPTNVMYPKEVIYYTLDYNDPAQVEKYKLNKDNVGIKSIPINVLYKNGYQSASVALENEIEEESVDENGNKIFTSKAPYKICVPIGTLWPIERVNIRDAYTAFGDYVKDGSTEFYGNSSTQVGLNLYEKAPKSKIQDDLLNNKWDKGTTVLVSESSSSSTVDVVWEGNESRDGTAITLYNFDFKQGQTLRFFGSGTITVVCGSGSGTGVITNGSMEAGFVDVTIRDADVASKLSQGIQVSGSNFSLTKIVVL